MPRFFAFLRAINVGGHNVTMEKLRGLFEALGHKDVETFIASGNVIFASKSKDRGALERKIENSLRKSLGYEVTTFPSDRVRTCGNRPTHAVQSSPRCNPQAQSPLDSLLSH